MWPLNPWLVSCTPYRNCSFQNIASLHRTQWSKNYSYQTRSFSSSWSGVLGRGLFPNCKKSLLFGDSLKRDWPNTKTLSTTNLLGLDNYWKWEFNLSCFWNQVFVSLLHMVLLPKWWTCLWFQNKYRKHRILDETYFEKRPTKQS